MRLGFIAMSGVRPHNPELIELGLRMPALADRSKAVSSLPSLGLLTLAGMTPKDIDVEYVEVPDVNALAGLPGAFDFVAISSFTARIKDAYRLADRFRAAGTHVILGGPHVTALAGEGLRHADTVVLGEGETCWPIVIADMRRGKLRQIYDGRSQAFDLRDAPMPRFELLEPSRYARVTVQTQRGCPFSCEFCAASIRLSPTYKVKPVEKVISEVRRIKELSPHPFIEFADDNTFVNRPHSKRLMRALIGEHIRWFTESDIAVADDPELLQLISDAGCAQILIGLESVSIAGLEGLEQKADWKAKQLHRYQESIARIQDFGISVNGCFVLGLDGTGPESFGDILRFIRESGLDDVQLTVLTPFPGTPLYDRLLAAGRILDVGAWERCTLFDISFTPNLMTVADLDAGFRRLVRDVYDEESVGDRRRRVLNRRRRIRKDRNARRSLCSIERTGSGLSSS
jgi:radical SAM superfamily enzyme YgiQ (UPF0313 family)